MKSKHKLLGELERVNDEAEFERHGKRQTILRARKGRKF